MPVVRITNYRIAPGTLAELLTQRIALIDRIRSANPGLTETRLIRLEDGSYTDIWRWESAEHMLAAFGDARGLPLVGVTMSLTSDATAMTGEIVDER
ncbi:hypothetical protein LTV02_27575 [Nocardia yamanashiensis]|uniref:hypothetical protein n=1 Tax=Nocardia yamanashiensis TaxID=209247 RepID=UPI000830DB45|nr:hypothetical protein [Nocardia yamanashiensis]UGT39801.1 hypothetical protein LTV02_27575 [Nocardia yamanashiensis]